MVGDAVEISLDTRGRFERAQFAQLSGSELELAAGGRIRHRELGTGLEPRCL